MYYETFKNTVMETVTITPNLKLSRLWHGILGSMALLLTSYYFYELMTGNMSNDWYIYLPISIWVMIHGLGRALGYYELSFPQISLDDNKLSVSGQDEGEIDLDKLSWMRLKKNRIEYEIQWSGYRGHFKIPWNFRIKSRLVPLKKALHARCRHQKIKFESEL